jgi:hypothetical protein
MAMINEFSRRGRGKKCSKSKSIYLKASPRNDRSEPNNRRESIDLSGNSEPFRNDGITNKFNCEVK